MKLRMAMAIVATGLAFSGCVTRQTAKAMYTQGRLDSYTEVANLQKKFELLGSCTELFHRAFPGTNAETMAALEQGFKNALVPAPSPTPTPTPAPVKKAAPKKN